jgi:hypothetical protein
MNEQNLAKKITQHLNFGLTQIEDEVLARLKTARAKALAAHRPAPQQAVDLATAGACDIWQNGDYRPFTHAWVPLAALVFGLLLADYWQTYHYQPLNNTSEIDAFLLAEDLPVNAYLDDGFDTWLENSAQQP